MIIEEIHQAHLRRGIVVGRDRVIMILNLFGVAGGGGKNAVDLEIERVIERGIEFERSAVLCSGVRFSGFPLGKPPGVAQFITPALLKTLLTLMFALNPFVNW